MKLNRAKTLNKNKTEKKNVKSSDSTISPLKAHVSIRNPVKTISSPLKVKTDLPKLNTHQNK